MAHGRHAENFGKQRFAQNLGRGAGGEKATAAEHTDPVAGRGLVQIVQRDDAGYRQAPDQVHERKLMADVEVVGRFVQKEEIGGLGKRAGDVDALSFSAGEGVPETIGERGHLHCAKGARHRSIVGPTPPAQRREVGRAPKSDSFADGQAIRRVSLLLDECNALCAPS